MCLTGPVPMPVPASVSEAVAMAQAGLGWLAGADAAALTSVEQAECLLGLERAESTRTAARSAVLFAFAAAGGYEADGHGSAKSWLRWQAQLTTGAAGAAVGWARRLAAHPAVRDALASAQISVSFARCICDWTDLLPEAHRADADAILLAAAAGGAELSDLAALAQEMRQRTARPDSDGGDDGFAGRWVRLETTFGGAGRLDGDLTPPCAEALGAVLDSLGKKAGPEDVRSRRQREHDALEEACRRLIASGCLPDRAGQATQIQLHMTLDQLRGLDEGGSAEAAWAARGAAAGPGADCDASIVPVVSGHVDSDVLDRLAAALLADTQPLAPGSLGMSGCLGTAGTAGGRGVPPGRDRPSGQDGVPPGESPLRWRRSQRAARQLILAAAADVLSGPAGLAACLRDAPMAGLAASVSLPLDVGTAADTIPVHLRRAVTARDRYCRFPGCHQPASVCHPHHIIPRAQGGPTSLANLLSLCAFHHLIAIHRWGWGIVLHPDGTTTATSPDGTRTLHSHGPPGRAA
jgi:hypothetical protein